MKHSLLDPLAACMLVLVPLSAPVAAQDSVVAEPVVASEPEPFDPSEEVRESLERLDHLVQLGQDLEAELVSLKVIVSVDPAPAQLRARLVRYVDELIERARRAWVDERDLAELRRKFAEARVDRALDHLEDRARAGGWTAAQFERVLADWIARGRAYVDAPDPEAFRVRLVAALERASAGARTWADIVSVLRGELLDHRIEDALALLRQRVADGSMTDDDLARVVKLIAARRAFASGEVQRYGSALDDPEQVPVGPVKVASADFK